MWLHNLSVDYQYFFKIINSINHKKNHALAPLNFL